MPSAQKPHVVIVGGGFGGLSTARALAHKPVQVTLVDRANYHLFQPLLYQVAMSGLSPGQVAQPIRGILRRQNNARVVLGEVADISTQKRRVCLRDGSSFDYDYLVMAAGASTHYFGNDQWAEHAFGLKDIEDALHIRKRVLLAFEAAEREPDPVKRRALLTFVVVGGGPTGVELAGALSELARTVLAHDFQTIKPHAIRVLLVEMADRVLPPFHAGSSYEARRQLENLGVEVRTSTPVTNVEEGRIEIDQQSIDTSTIIWAAGVRPVPLAEQLGAPMRRGKVVVRSDCSIAEHPDVFVIGDMAHFVAEDGQALPGLAPVAMQQGRFVARSILRDLNGRDRDTFRYVDKGMMATVGRSRAVLESGRIRMSGFWAWVAWTIVHIWYLIGFRNRVAVLLDWIWSYITYKRGARLITRDAPPFASLPESLRPHPQRDSGSQSSAASADASTRDVPRARAQSGS